MIQRLVKLHRSWLQKRGSRIYERDLVFFNEDLQELETGSDRALPNIADSLNTFGIYYGILGVIQLVDGCDDGWDHISASLGYHGWSITLEVENYFRQKRLGAPTLGVANHAPLAACVAAVSSQWEDRMTLLLKRLGADSEFSVIANRRSRGFETFVVHLLSNTATQLDSMSVEDMPPPYQEVIDCWNEERLAQAMYDACDYHLARVEQAPDEEFSPEFKYPPFDLLPVEWMVVRRVRDQLQLATPDVSHPLIDLLKPPQPDITCKIDPAIEAQLIKLCSQYFS